MNKLICLLAPLALASADSFGSYQAPGSAQGGLGALSSPTFVGTSGPTFVGASGPTHVGGSSSFSSGSVGGGSSFSGSVGGGSSFSGSVGGGSSFSGSVGGGSHGGASHRGGSGEPQVTRNIYLYEAPAQAPAQVAPAQMPPRRVHYNFVFVRTAHLAGGAQPLVAPAPQQKTLVYLLSKRPSAGQQQVIEVPHTPTQPEVFFVNYNDGDNTDLPGGVSLQEALSASVQQGQVIQGGPGAGGSAGHSGAGHSGAGLGASHGSGLGAVSGGLRGGYSAPQ